MKFFEQALQNVNLEFIDNQNANVYSLEDISSLNFLETNKVLVFAYLDNSIEAISIFWSLMKSNHCIALLSPSLANHFKEDLEELYKPVLIFDNVRIEISGYDNLNEKSIKYFQLIKKDIFRIDDEVKVLISTSGTTGSPKFVKLSEENLIANAVSICDYLPINSTDVTPLNLPIFYSYGLSILTSNALKGGRIICTNDDPLKKEFWESFHKYGYTSFAGVPFVYEMLDRIGFTKKTYNSLKYFTQAGGKLQDALVSKYGQYAYENGLKFYVMYGQTEATARMSFLSPEFTLDKVGSIGKPILNGSFSIDETTGELSYIGPNVFGGYVEKREDLSSFVAEKILKTGDIARIDEDGFYYITGRLKRVTKIFGNRINLDEVEALIFKQFGVSVRCVGFNDSQLVLFTVDEKLDLKELNKFISTDLKLHISVVKSKYIVEMPLTLNGKIDYKELIKMYGAK
ncbi:AMP-binding protein [Flavobacterium sp. GT3P67]|uniref:AMP-binding protein n=1 Tax=Flavobacterium sp. GT3P67 TaxID=2541722 RepID=UPI00104D3F3A|nr:AMP-binding protein [Flavobacterium sp. GT3P67]TDE51284.1 long-chain fatty acid--CoA ligase [Flavobacterium sp. GT3P67]